MLRALKVPAFARLAATYTSDELADWMAMVALAVLVYDRTKDPLATTALFVACRFLPGLVVPALAGRLEGLPGGRLLGCVYGLGAVCLFALAATAEAFWLPSLLALTFAFGTLAAVGRTVTRALTPALLEPAGILREGNAVLNFGFAAMSAGGPIAAGALVAFLSPGAVVAVAGVLFAAQAICMWPCQGIPEPVEDDGASWHGKLRSALSYVRGHALLRILLGGQLVAFVLFMMVAPIEVVLAKETLGAGDVGYGALAGAWGVGMIVGSAIFARERNRPILVLAGIATAVMALGYLGMAAAPTIVVACIASGLGGIGNGVQWIGVITAVQEATEPRFQNRVAGLVEAVLTVGPGLGFPLGGLIAAGLGARATFAVSGLGVLLVLFAAAVVVLGSRGARAHAANPADAALPEADPEPLAA